MFPKPKRKVDRKLLDSFKTKPCAVLNKDCIGEVCAHHVKTKGSGGGDVVENLLALCVRHHRDIHDMGSYSFMQIHGLIENDQNPQASPIARPKRLKD